MSTRTHPTRGRVVATSLAALTTVLLTAGPAFADNPIGPAEGEDPGDSLGLVKTLLLYVGVPVVSALVIFAVVWLPGAVNANRYRPAKGWHAAPVWFAGPPAPVEAVQSAELGDVVRGGARGDW